MSLTVKNYIKSIQPLKDAVIVTEMNFKERITSGGIVLLSDDGKTTGIRPRWGQVYAVGPEQQDVSPGDWICVAHGRWTRGVEVEDASGTKTLRKVDPDDILLISDVKPSDDTLSDAVHAEQKQR
jgi:co-chaperonin GroES (HSP10)